MAERKNWEFLLQQEGDRTWLPLESPDVEILEGRYRVLVRSNLKRADIEVRITHEATEEDPPKRRIQKRNQRTSPDGLMVVMPFTLLQPGIWELDCSSGVMTDLLGSSCQYSVQLHVLPRESENEGDWEPDWAMPALDLSIVSPTETSLPAEPDRSQPPEPVREDEIRAHPPSGEPKIEEMSALESMLQNFSDRSLEQDDLDLEPFFESIATPTDWAEESALDAQAMDEDMNSVETENPEDILGDLEGDWDEDTLFAALDLPVLETPSEPSAAPVVMPETDLEISWLESGGLAEDLEADTIAVVSESGLDLDAWFDEGTGADLDDLSADLDDLSDLSTERPGEIDRIAEPSSALPAGELSDRDDFADFSIDLPDILLEEFDRPLGAGEEQDEVAIDDAFLLGVDPLQEGDRFAELPLDLEEAAFAIADESPEIELVLLPDTYEISADQPLVLTGQVRSGSSATIEAATMPDLVLNAILRDPQTGQTLVEQSYPLMASGWPIDLHLPLDLPDIASTQLLLGEATLIDRTAQRILARQPFTVTAALEDVLARLRQRPPQDVEPTIEEPEPPALNIDLAFLGLVNKAADAPPPETQSAEQLGLMASPGQTLPPQIRANSEPTERRSIDLPGFLPPNPKTVPDPSAHPAPEPNEDLLELFDETPIEAEATDWLAELDELEPSDRKGVTEPLSFEQNVLDPSSDEAFERSPHGDPQGITDRSTTEPSIELIEPPEDFLAEFNADLTPPSATLGLDEDLESVLTEDLFTATPIDLGATFPPGSAQQPLDWELGLEDLEDDEAVNTIDVEAAALPDPFEALNLKHRFMDRLSSFAEETQAQEAAQMPPAPPLPVNPFVTMPLETAPALSESVVMEDVVPVAMPSIGADEPENPLKLADDQPVPMPILEVEDRAEVMAGQPLLVRVKLPSVLPKLYVKLWINDRQTRTLLDGPRYLVDFVPNGLGDLEATTQLTVPMGSLTIQIEAVTIETATKRESYKASASLTVVPPNLPEFSLDDFGF